MRKQNIFIALVLMVSAFGSAFGAELRSSKALSHSVSAKKFTAELKEGFHFNLKAPNQVVAQGTAQKKLKVDDHRLEFELPAKYSDAKAMLYVCDDAVTFCEVHQISLTEGQSAGAKTQQPGKSKATKTRMDSEGFFKDAFSEAIESAKSQKKLVFIEFSAKWCPGCVRYDKEIFPSKEFKKITEGYVKLKIDVDQFENFPLSEKFRVQGIPTVVILNSEEKEVGRIVDFQTVSALRPLLAGFLADPTPLETYLSQSSNLDSKQNLLVGQRFLAAGQSGAALGFLQKVKPEPEELLKAEVQLAKENYEKNPESKNAYLEKLRMALKKESKTLRSLDWRLELLKLVDVKSDEAKAILKDGIELTNLFLQNPEELKKGLGSESVGEFTGYEKLLIAMYKADLLETAQQSEKLQAEAWKQAAEIGQAYKIQVGQKGPSLRYLIVLSAAKNWIEAETLANRLLVKDPQNVDVKRRKLKILMALDKNKEAVELAESILPQAEGRNQFWVGESLAKAHLKLNDKVSAKKVIVAFLGKPEIQTQKMASTKKNFESLLKETE